MWPKFVSPFNTSIFFTFLYFVIPNEGTFFSQFCLQERMTFNLINLPHASKYRMALRNIKKCIIWLTCEYKNFSTDS